MRTKKNRAESVRHRLRNLLRERGEDIQFGLQRYAIERFLYRLGVSPHRNTFILKGAALYAVWGGSIYRPTRDLDFTGYCGPEEGEVMVIMRDICVLPNIPDEIVFDPHSLSTSPILHDSDYHGLRVQLRATLGESRIPIQIDIGFGDAIYPSAQDVDYPTLLGDPCPRIRAYPPEAVVAEKFHTMVMQGERNSRYKDFYDIFVLLRQFTFKGEDLAKAVSSTFERRRTEIGVSQPSAFEPGFYADTTRAQQWRAFLATNNLPGPNENFLRVGNLILEFLIPIWEALAAKQTFKATWSHGGPWK